MQLTAYISSAADGYFLVRTKEVPDLVVRVSIISDLSQAVRAAAASLTGKSENVVDVVFDY